jgi:tetratricopeptide (TPR) repeat protein
VSENNSGAFSLRSVAAIEREISVCQDPAQRLVLFARKAGNLATHSYIIDAKRILEQLRSQNREYDPRLTGWINFSEGLVEHFELLDNKAAKAKFTRALLFSQMSAERELAGASAAWLAHCEFVDSNLDAFSASLSKALEWSLPSEHETRGRSSMLLADAYNAIGDSSSARHWFRIARNHASESGNIAMQNVMLFNIAAYGVSRITLDDCLSITDPIDIHQVGMEVASAANLNGALGIGDLPAMVPAMRAEFLIVERKWEEAISILSDHPSDVVTSSPSRIAPKLFAQRAWCYANVGNRERAESDMNRALSTSQKCIDDDDGAILFFRLAAAAEINNNAPASSEYLNIANVRLNLFREHQVEIKRNLEGVLAKISDQ